MNLYTLLKARAEGGRPIRAGLIGAGKFGSMILSQARFIEGLHIVGVADLNVTRARESLARVGWEAGAYQAPSFGEAMDTGGTFVTEDAMALTQFDGIEIIIDATGHPLAGVRHALSAIDHNKHVVMVNVEADVLCGPWLAARAKKQGVLYSMAYGDQPALICELVDWVRSCGFELVAAGKGMKYVPDYRYSTPDTVWDHFGWSKEEVAAGDFNPKMYNSFVDGTKSAIEMAAVANATGLSCPDNGLGFYPCGTHDLARVFRPESDGGRLPKSGLAEVAASEELDGRQVHNDIRWGVWATFRAPCEYTRDCFRQYGLKIDESGWYGSSWRPFHIIGLEAAISVLSCCLRGEPTGSSKDYRGDAVAIAKADLQAGSMLDGEGGYAVVADALPASTSAKMNALPIGLAHHVKLKKHVAKDQIVTMDDVDVTEDLDIVKIREEQKAMVAD